MLIGHIIHELEKAAPPALQEGYDNTGLILGNAQNECTGVLISVDVTEAVVEEAINEGCNLIIGHHPLIFSGLKRLTGSTPQQRTVLKAIRAGISVYACHTSLDSTRGGVSQRMASMLGLTEVEPLEPVSDQMVKLQTYVPTAHLEDVRHALFDAGAGHIGNYDSCSYTIAGQGTFRALTGADPYVGSINELHTEAEECLQMILPRWRKNAVESALRQVHPYEEPAYEFIAVDGSLPGCGLGAVGNLKQSVTVQEFAEMIKQTFGSPTVRSNATDFSAPVRRVALCGGSGASLIKRAIGAHAQVMLTSDVKYHDFTDMAGVITIMDIGHHESENCSKTIIFDIISEKFPNFAVRYAQSDVNPIKYL